MPENGGIPTAGTTPQQLLISVGEHVLGADSMTWQIVYNHRGAVALRLVKGRASALDAACDILDSGGQVYRIEIPGTLVAIHAEELRKICVERKDASRPAST